MNHINVGAYVDGVRPKTKKALKEAVKAGKHVEFDGTALRDEGNRYTVQHTIANQNDVLQVTGPNPYRDRRWYATVKNGKVT